MLCAIKDACVQTCQLSVYKMRVEMNSVTNAMRFVTSSISLLQLGGLGGAVSPLNGVWGGASENFQFESI